MAANSTSFPLFLSSLKQLLPFCSYLFGGVMTPKPCGSWERLFCEEQQVVREGDQLLGCLCAQSLRGSFACSSQGKWCCPDETHIGVVAFDLSQAFLWALNKEVSVWLFSQQTNRFGGVSSLYPAWLNSLLFDFFFPLELLGGSLVKVLWMRRIHFSWWSPWSIFIQDHLYGLSEILVFCRCLWL